MVVIVSIKLWKRKEERKKERIAQAKRDENRTENPITRKLNAAGLNFTDTREI